MWPLLTTHHLPLTTYHHHHHLVTTTTCHLPAPTTYCCLPGLLLQGASQGGVLLGEAGRWTGDALTDRVAGMEKPVKCASPFVASGGAVCAATRQQVARVCVAALGGGPGYSRRVVEVVTRPEVADDGTMRVDGTMARTLG